MIAPLASGELDAGGGGVAAGLFNAVGRGVSLKIVGDKSSSPRGMATGALMLRSELITSGRYRSLADMRGWTLALPAQATATSATLDRYLATAGMSLKEMHLVYLSFPAMVSALQNAAVEGAFMVEPGITRVEDLGVARWIAGDDEMSPGHEIAVSLNSEQFLRNDRDSALRYMRALLRGIRDYTDTVEAGHLHGPGAEAMIAILTEYSLIKDAALYRRIRMPATDPDGRLNIASLEADLAYFRAQGLIKGDVQVADVVDSSLAEQAVRALGPYRRTQ